MKLVTFETQSGETHIGAMTADLAGIVDFTASDAAPTFRDMLALIDGGEPGMDRARKLALGEAPPSLCPPPHSVCCAPVRAAPDARLPLLRDASAAGAR